MAVDSIGILSPSFSKPKQIRKSSLSSVPVSPPRSEPSMTPSQPARTVHFSDISDHVPGLVHFWNKFMSEDIIRELLTGSYKAELLQISPEKQTIPTKVQKSPAPKVKSSASPSISPKQIPKKAKTVETVHSDLGVSDSSSENELPIRRNLPRKARGDAVPPVQTLERTAMRPRRQRSPTKPASKRAAAKSKR